MKNWDGAFLFALTIRPSWGMGKFIRKQEYTDWDILYSLLFPASTIVLGLIVGYSAGDIGEV